MATNLHTTHMFTQNIMHLVTINEDYKRLLSKMYTNFKAVVKEVMDYDKQQSIITLDISSTAMANDIANIYFGTLVNWVITNGVDSLEELMGDTLDHYLFGISIISRI